MKPNRRREVSVVALCVILLWVIDAPLARASGDSWTPMSTAGAPDPRGYHTTVWTGSRMIVWGGYASSVSNSAGTGGLYDPATDTWTATATDSAPGARDDQTAVWTGTSMIVWGGDHYSPFSVYGDGAAYDPEKNLWSPVSSAGAPTPRFYQSAVWTGSKMIVWGGFSRKGPGIVVRIRGEVSQDAGAVNTGAVYDPETDTWKPMSTTHAPSPRGFHTAVWTGTKMIVWGGNDGTGSGTNLNSGGIYDPETDTWTATSATAAPTGRFGHSAVWTGSAMVIWGGHAGSGASTNTGGVFDPETNTWTATSTVGAPSARTAHIAEWIGSKMVVWGGDSNGSPDAFFGDGGLYDPVTNSWAPIATAGAPAARAHHQSVFTGSSVIVWGGDAHAGFVNTGGAYTPPSNCPADGARQCVTPISGAAGAHSSGRPRPHA